MTVYVFCTASASQNFGLGNGVSVLIHGGANVQNRQLWTPKGVMTTVTDEDFALLMKHPDFTGGIDSGFITYSKTKEDPEEIAKGMSGKDNSAQKAPDEIDAPVKKGK